MTWLPADHFVLRPGHWYRPDGAITDQVRHGAVPLVGDGDAVWSFVHINDAICATVATIGAAPGIYNVMDDDPSPVALWLPAFARWVRAPALPRSVEDAMPTVGEAGIYHHTELTGAANARAKAELGCAATATLEECLERPVSASSTHPVPMQTTAVGPEATCG